jgi:ParB family chromosome partitioning protein
MSKQALGKGLGALIKKVEKIEIPDGRVETADIHSIDLNPQQPRKEFEESALAELKESIKGNGILQPILVRKRNDRYELIAGERRLRAARELGWQKVPVLIKEASDEHSLEIALIENIQRKDLNPMEEARAYMRLMRDYEMTQEKIGEKLGKNRATVANLLRLLNLPEEIQEMLEKNVLSFGHAKAILGLGSPSEQIKLAKEITSRGLSVREAEEKVQEQRKVPVHRYRILKKDPVIREIEEKLERSLHTKINIKQGAKKGRIEIEYYSRDDLERLVQTLSQEN